MGCNRSDAVVNEHLTHIEVDLYLTNQEADLVSAILTSGGGVASLTALFLNNASWGALAAAGGVVAGVLAATCAFYIGWIQAVNIANGDCGVHITAYIVPATGGAPQFWVNSQ